jgi:ribonuclease D
MNETAAQKLYDALSHTRLQLARAEGKPAFTVFNNRTLREMATMRPKNREQFLKVHGVGEIKWEKYGSQFLEIIENYPLSEEPKQATLCQALKAAADALLQAARLLESRLTDLEN